MGKRYYCDFCDRSFADSANNRKNHFKGGNHQRLRKLHYDSFKGRSRAKRFKGVYMLNGTVYSCRTFIRNADLKLQVVILIESQEYIRRSQLIVCLCRLLITLKTSMHYLGLKSVAYPDGVQGGGGGGLRTTPPPPPYENEIVWSGTFVVC